MLLLFHHLFYNNRLQIARGFDIAQAMSFLRRSNLLHMQATGAAHAALFLFSGGAGEGTPEGQAMGRSHGAVRAPQRKRRGGLERKWRGRGVGYADHIAAQRRCAAPPYALFVFRRASVA